MGISELALGLFTNLLYDSFKNIPEYIFDTSSKVYDKAIEEFSNQNYKLIGIQIDTFFHQENVEKAIEKYLKNPDKLDCSNILIHEFFELFNDEDFSREEADLILNSFFEIIDAEIEKEPELRDYLKLYLAKKTYKTVQETNQGVQELSQDVKEISHKVQEMHEVINGGIEYQDKKESGVDFEKSLEKYLNKIIEEDGKNGISEVYTELSAKEILQVTLKFHDEESDIPQEYKVLELVEKEEKLIIFGESGSGKTTTLKWLNYILATSYLEGKNEKIPLYIELNFYINEERFIKKPFDAYVAMKAKEKGISEDILETILKGKAIILLDGFDLLSPTDEFHPYDKISNFITDYNNCRFVISSRPGFFESIKSSFKVSELEKLNDEKIETFINRYVSNEELANTLKDKILSSQQLKSILSNPMMLYIAIKVAMGRKDNSGDLLPSNSSELYEAFISTLFIRQKKKGKDPLADRIQIENALTDLYFKLKCRNEVSCKYSEALKFVKKSSEDPLFKEISPQLILEDCSNLGIFYKNDNYVSYGIHQSFQEYFAAIKLKELFESGYDVAEAFSHPKWEEVVIFTSEMLDSNSIDKFIDLMLLKDELFLASKCVNKASNNTKEKLCALLADKMDSKYRLDKINSIESLERIGTTGTSIIAEALKDKDSYVRKSAAEALGNIKYDIAVQPLINALKDEDSYVRWSVAEALGNIKSDISVQSLINALKDEDSCVRWSVAEALGNIKSDISVQSLINALKDEDSEVREGAACALGDLEADSAIEPLINLLKDKDQDKDVRQKAARALGDIKAHSSVKVLISLLKDKDKDVREGAACALGDIKAHSAIEPLISLLKDKDEDKDVRQRAAQALENLEAHSAVEPLISLLKDKGEDKDVRQSVASTLGNLKAGLSVKPLISILKDDDQDKDVRKRVAFALGDLEEKSAIEPFISILKNKDEDKDVREGVACALSDLKAHSAVELLISLLKDKNEDKYVRWWAAHSLGELKVKSAVEPFISILNDKSDDNDVRGRVAYKLGDLKVSSTSYSLIKILKNKDENIKVRGCAAHSLGEIKVQSAVEPLISLLPLTSLLKGEDELVKWEISEALKKICTIKNKGQLESFLKLESEFTANIAFEILSEIEKKEKSKLILFKELKECY